jgi:hypothetical protein
LARRGLTEPEPGGHEHSLRTFVLSAARAADVDAATGGGVVALAPGNRFALADALAAGPVAAPVLITGTRAQEQAIRTMATFAVARWPESRVAWRTAPVAVLAVANAAALAARSGLVPSLALHLFDLLIERTWSCAWVRSVAGLPAPSPTLGQHLRSWLPRAGFVVLHQPRAQVVAVSGIDPVPIAISDRRTMLLVGGDAPPEVVDKVAAMAGASTYQKVPAIADGKLHYGTANAAELVGSPIVPEDRALLPTGECSSCSMPLATLACPFCHAAAGGAHPARRAS